MFSRFFIDRPIFATVLSIAITLAGGLALLVAADRDVSADRAADGERDLPVSRRQRQVVAETVAAPIEQQVNGVENMMYMSSTCTNDGNYSLTVTFKHGIDMNLAQVLVQNRVALAVPLLAGRHQGDRRDDQEAVARHPAGDRHLLARTAGTTSST